MLAASVVLGSRPPLVKMEAVPEDRAIYEGAFLVLRDVRACRSPEGVVSTGDEST